MSKRVYRLAFKMQEVIIDDDGTESPGRLTVINDEVPFKDVCNFMVDAARGVAFVHTGLLPMRVITIESVLNHYQKISAIKLIRAASGCALKVAKDAIECTVPAIPYAIFSVLSENDGLKYAMLMRAFGYVCRVGIVPIERAKQWDELPHADTFDSFIMTNPEYARYMP